jgi:hypothetical protein
MKKTFDKPPFSLTEQVDHLQEEVCSYLVEIEPFTFLIFICREKGACG